MLPYLQLLMDNKGNTGVGLFFLVKAFEVERLAVGRSVFLPNGLPGILFFFASSGTRWHLPSVHRHNQDILQDVHTICVDWLALSRVGKI